MGNSYLIFRCPTCHKTTHLPQKLMLLQGTVSRFPDSVKMNEVILCCFRYDTKIHVTPAEAVTDGGA